MVILLLNSRFLGEEASEKPRRWCQVSTWSWPINRNLIYSFLGTSKQFLIWEFFIFSLSREFSIFSHFLTTQTCLVRPNLQAWVAKSRFFSEKWGSRGKIYGELEKWAWIAKVIWSNWLINWILGNFLFKVSWMISTMQTR